MKKISKSIEILLAGALALSPATPLGCSSNRIIKNHETEYGLETTDDDDLYEQKWITIFGESYITETVSIEDSDYLDFIIAPTNETSTEYTSSINNKKPKFPDDAKTIFNKIYVPKKTEFGALNIRETEIYQNDSEKFKAIELVVRENPHNRLNDYELELAKSRYFYFEPIGTEKRVPKKLPIYFMFYDGTSLRENNDSRKITAVGEVYRPVEISLSELVRLTSPNSRVPLGQNATTNCTSMTRQNGNSFTAINGDTIWHD